MARTSNGIVTFKDLQYMVDNMGYVQKNPIPDSHRCCRKQDIIEHIYADVDTLYASNRLIPFGLIKRQMVLDPIAWSPTYSAQFMNFNIIYDGAWTATTNAGWININIPSGTGNTTNLMVVQMNSSTTSTRSGTITVTATSSGATGTINITQGMHPVIPTSSVQLGYSVSYYPDSCNATKNTFYIPLSSSFGSTTVLYNGSNGNSFATAGWYSGMSGGFPNRAIARYWNGSNSFTTTEDC